jgi:hypothetical protein
MVLSIRPFIGTENILQNNIKMGLQSKGWVGVEWISLAQDRDKWRDLTEAVKNLQVP